MRRDFKISRFKSGYRGLIKGYSCEGLLLSFHAIHASNSDAFQDFKISRLLLSIHASNSDAISAPCCESLASIEMDDFGDFGVETSEDFGDSGS